MDVRLTWSWDASEICAPLYEKGDTEMKLNGRLVRVANVTDSERNQMFSLMDTYYEHMDRSAFEADLGEKQWVILLQDPAHGFVRGFSTQMMLELVVEDRPIRALFSGDTIVDHDHWAQNPLAQVWGQFALSLMDDDLSAPLYWFLIAKGYKTYRFLPVFFHEFYPRHDGPTPAWASSVIDALGRHMYPTAYDSGAGIVRADHFGCRLRAKVAEITNQRLRDPQVRFFAEKNPGHTRGDELCCIAPLTRENFTSAAYRVIGSTSALSQCLS